MELSKKQMTTAEQAFAYHVQGYNVMPVRKNKKPLLSSWIPQQTAEQSDDQIIDWWKQYPNAPIAILTGKKSGIVVVDIDTYAGGKDIFPPTFTVRTGNGGLQKYYQYIPGFTVSASSYPSMPNIDIRGDGGYCIGAGSTTDYIDDKTGKKAGGEYVVIDNRALAPFPIHLFPKIKQRKSLTEKLTATEGSRNDNLTSFAGQLMQAEKNEKKWATDVLPAMERANKSYPKPLPDKEVLTIFNSVSKKELTRRENLTTSPIVVDGAPTGETMAIQKSRSGLPFMTMSNVVAILEAHPDFRSKIRYNLFRQEIEIDGIPIEDNDILKVQYTLQTKFGLHSINKDAVFSALVHCAYDNAYDEAKDWLTSLKWDGTHRLFTWLITATGVQDNAYNRGAGTQWFIQIVDRIMNPGCIADYCLVLVGGQGIGKTSLFRILGDKWYKSFTGSVENKDFYLTLRGAIILDMDEGATLYKAEALKIKSIITHTHDEFRAPYDRVPKKFPRRFVFSMSTNDVEPFRDATGNRRFFPIDIEGMVKFDWLKENREQLFAEALHWLKDKDNANIVPQVPQEDAERIQQEHLPDDSWTDSIVEEVQKSYDYCKGSIDYSTTISEVFKKVFPDESMIRLDKKYEMRIGTIFKNQLGLVKIQKMIDGERKNRWYITEAKMKQLQSKNAKKTITELDELVDDLKQPPLKEF